ncbi:diaminobutyrate--2-oxoglutarate aminotransferase [Salinisphaera hydrothermalis C41B8]|uniref:Diaminobutyrate--2-oxoglutarate transaminase n=2 Tax=Salinisphaera TaxID=180541 RepID=A0A084IIF0_SALHC|nr:diaminobutyrate--2-oxoglutarate transaminase [Salinisphaera hydrothermalis]KEZ76484.1 diaminobutyrate--2-oxoglutarate aminotransferase [Salinisphaera hydrothermalis C41B8]
MSMDIINRLESEVRGYVRSFPTEFKTARGNRMTDVDGHEYLDFFSGAGALNYGHNDPDMEATLLDYIKSGGINHGLDMATEAKTRFMETFEEIILKPRKLDYKFQFPGPTGTNAVEAALKLARKYTGRSGMIHFTHSFHGMTLGSTSVTSNAAIRNSAGVGLSDTTTAAFDGYYRDGRDTIADLEALLADSFSGVDKPAAVIVETVQGEGGIYAAGFDWLREVARVCREHDLLFIVDDIQAGYGRTGPFFSFEPADIQPDIVTLAKSISGMGSPMSLVLMRPEIDVWDAGEHTGTFRGNNHAFVTGATALEKFWRDDQLTRHVDEQGERIRTRLQEIIDKHDGFDGEVRGRGFFIGLDCAEPDHGNAVIKQCFERGLIMETTGPGDRVIKVMPPLISTAEDIDEGLAIIDEAIGAALAA